MKIKILLSLGSLAAIIIICSGFVSPKPIAQEKLPISKQVLKKVPFAQFLSHFERIDMPFEKELSDLTLNVNRLNKLNTSKSKSIKSLTNDLISKSQYIPEISSHRMSRMAPPKIEPIARFYPNKNAVAVIYKPKYTFAVGQESYMMVVYDLKGNMVFPHQENEFTPYHGFLLAHTSLENLSTCKIDQYGNILRKLYNNKWKVDVREHGYEDNQITACSLSETEIYNFNNKGVLEKRDKLVGVNIASLN